MGTEKLDVDVVQNLRRAETNNMIQISNKQQESVVYEEE